MPHPRPSRCRWRKLAITLLAATALPTRADASGPAPVRIVTFNAEILTAPRVRAGQINKFRFDDARQRHLERVADVIETLSPDVLNLVEVTSVEAVDRIVALLHEKGMTDYRGYHCESNDHYTGMDVALISRIGPDTVDGRPIRTIYSKAEDPTWRQAYSFRTADGSQRSKTTSLSRNSMYFLTVNGWKLGFFGLHLKSNPSGAEPNARRTAQAEIVVRAIRGEITRRGYLPVVLGDLNDYDPDLPDRDPTRSAATNVLRRIKDFDPEPAGPELFNAARRITRVRDRYTSHWDWNENGAADPQDVFTMIDHVLLPNELEPHLKRCFIAHVVGLETSDHFPVVVDLVLPEAP